MKTKITKLEMELLNKIKSYTEDDFGSDSPMWCYTKAIKVNMTIMRGVISSLIQKGVVSIQSSQSENDALEVSCEYWEWSSESKDVAVFVNLEVEDI